MIACRIPKKSPRPHGQTGREARMYALYIRFAPHCMRGLLRAGEGSVPYSPYVADPHALDGSEWRDRSSACWRVGVGCAM